MKLSSLVFPAPAPSYNAEQLGGLIFVPNLYNKTELNFKKEYTEKKFRDGVKSPETYQIKDSYFVNGTTLIQETKEQNVPCLFLPHEPGGSSKLLLFFHANAEDIGMCKDFLYHLRDILRVNILAMEYAGYGIYTKAQSSQVEKRSLGHK